MKDDKPDLFNELQRKAREHTEKYGPINSLYELYALLKQHLDLIWDYTKNDAFHAITGEIKNLVAIALNGLEFRTKPEPEISVAKTAYYQKFSTDCEKDIPSPHLDKKEYKTVGIPESMSGISDNLLKIARLADTLGIKIMCWEYANYDKMPSTAEVLAIIDTLGEPKEKTEDHTDSIIYNPKGLPHWKG